MIEWVQVGLATWVTVKHLFLCHWYSWLAETVCFAHKALKKSGSVSNSNLESVQNKTQNITLYMGCITPMYNITVCVDLLQVSDKTEHLSRKQWSVKIYVQSTEEGRNRHTFHTTVCGNDDE